MEKTNLKRLRGSKLLLPYVQEYCYCLFGSRGLRVREYVGESSIVVLPSSVQLLAQDQSHVSQGCTKIVRFLGIMSSPQVILGDHEAPYHCK